MYIPRIDQEVIVDFIEGDPDRPIITGRVYHGTNTPPYPLPDEKTKSTIKSDSSTGGGGSNEIRFEDKKGSEQIFIHAQKDMSEAAENNHSISAGANQSISAGADQSVSVSNNRTINVSGTHTETIAKDTKITISGGNYEHDVTSGTAKYHVQGDLTENYDATQTTNVKGAVTEKYDNKQKTTVAQDIVITSNESKIHVTAATEIQLEVGSSKLLMKSDGSIELNGTSVAINGAQSIDIHGASVTSKADADHNIEGKLVTSNGTATNTVKGGMVMLNP